MIINIIDRDFNFLGQIDEYQSFIANKKWHGIGNFELHLNINAAHTEYLQKENIIFTDESKAYVILYREIDSTTNKLVVKGLELKSYLARWLVFPPGGYVYYRVNSNIETIMKEYVQATLNRKSISNIVVAENKNRGVKTVYQSRYKNLADELEKLSLASNLSWDIALDLDNKRFIFDVVEDRNVTVNQDLLPPAIFSIDYDNIGEQKLIESRANYANTAIVAGQGEGVDRAITIVGNSKGLDSFELFVDARDLENDADLPFRGEQKLAEVQEIFTFDSEVLTDKNLVYEKDFKLGDVVTIQNSEWGISVNRRITELTEIYESSGFRLDVVFGEPIPTLIDMVKKATDTPVVEGGSEGEQGLPGTPGKDGVGLEYKWNGTELGIKREDETIFDYVNLEGPQGLQGKQGMPGLDGKSLEFHWNGTQLGIRIEGQAEYQYVELKGDKGDQGIQGEQGVRGLPGLDGKSLEYKWDGTQLGIRIEGQSSYQYVDLQGPPGKDGKQGLPGKDAVLPNEWQYNVIQTRDNFIGWEKNILFNATERYEVTETNSKALNLKEFFNGTLSPTNIPNINPNSPYILEVSGLPRTHTQNKGFVGWVSRYRYPTKFKIEIYDGSTWNVVSDINSYNKQYFYSNKINSIVEKIKFTIYEVNNMLDAYAQIGQFVFIHPEAGVMYDGLLAKVTDSRGITIITSPTEPTNLNVGDEWHREV